MPVNWHSRKDFRLQPPRSKRGALYIELRERLKRRRKRKAEAISLRVGTEAPHGFLHAAVIREVRLAPACRSGEPDDFVFRLRRCRDERHCGARFTRADAGTGD